MTTIDTTVNDDHSITLNMPADDTVVADVDVVIDLLNDTELRLEQEAEALKLANDVLEESYIVTHYESDHWGIDEEFVNFDVAVEYLRMCMTTAIEEDICLPTMYHPDGSGREYCLFYSAWS